MRQQRTTRLKPLLSSGGDPAVTLLLQALLIALLAQAGGVVSLALLRRELDFKWIGVQISGYFFGFLLIGVTVAFFEGGASEPGACMDRTKHLDHGFALLAHQASVGFLEINGDRRPHPSVWETDSPYQRDQLGDREYRQFHGG